MNVLSLFDGMSCGQIALNKINIKYDNYFASEIDKYAIKITQKNYPDTIQIGDITKVSYQDGILKTENGNFNISKIDLLMGGSPCQSFSFAGKQLNFDDPRSKLFFEYVRLLKECNPKYFLLENVKMKKEYQDIISNYVGIQPIEINSALVSAQNRRRLYWTNIKDINQPMDKGLVLKDVLEKGFVDKDKSFCLDANYFKGGNPDQYFNKHRQQLVFCSDNIKRMLENKNKGNKDINKKSKTLCSSAGSGSRAYIFESGLKEWRLLIPLECERLQTVPDNYTEGVSNTQRYKMLGNGWTVDVICHILKNMEL